MLVSTILVAAPVRAAGIGAGWDYDANSHLGAYAVPGGNGYCINPGLPPATSASFDAGVVSSFTSSGPTAGRNVVALGADTLAKVNYLVTVHGQTDDRDTAAAVAMAVATTANPAAYAAHTAPWGDDYYVHYMPAAHFARVKALAAQFRAEAAAITAAAAGSATLALSTDPDNGSGSLSIASLAPAAATASITLVNAVFAATGTADYRGPVSAGSSLPIRAVPPAGSTHYRVSARGEFTAGGGISGAVHLWTTPGRQALATPGGSVPGTFAAEAKDAADRSALFAPVATTRVPTSTIARGERASDTVSFAAGSFTDPVSRAIVRNPWPLGAEGPLPVTAVGTLYGPSPGPITPAAVPPRGTPVAAHATVTGGPGPHTVQSDAPVTVGGHYSWVWSIVADGQPEPSRALLPPGYRFSDAFGVEQEGQFAPALRSFSTRLASSVVTACGTVTDRLEPIDEELLRSNDGRVIPVTLTGRVYHTVTRPERSRSAPAGARLIGTVTQVLDERGGVTSEPLSVGCEPGYVTVQWSVESQAQPEQYRRLLEPWSDDFGMPDETARVVVPQKRLASTGVATSAGAIGAGVAALAGGVVLVARRRARS